MDDLVSIIIPTYNRKTVISRAIDSCINQTYSNIEIIICDDQSTDDTVSFLKEKYATEPRLKYCVTEEGHKGSNAARNQGVCEASGKYVTFLDSDDYLLEDSIQKRMVCFNDDGISMVYGNLYLECENQRIEWNYTNLNTVSNQKIYVLKELALCRTMTMIIKKSIFEQIGLLDETLPAWQDDALVLAIIVNGYRAYHCEQYVGVVIKSADGITSNKNKIFLGLKKLLGIYKTEIKEVSQIRYVVWKLRLFASWCHAKEMDSTGIIRFVFLLLHNIFRSLTRPFFVAYFE